MFYIERFINFALCLQEAKNVDLTLNILHCASANASSENSCPMLPYEHQGAKVGHLVIMMMVKLFIKMMVMKKVMMMMMMMMMMMEIGKTHRAREASCISSLKPHNLL